MYIINKIGDMTPPCFTPLDTETISDITFSHLVRITCEVYRLTKNPVTIGHTLRQINNLNSFT